MKNLLYTSGLILAFLSLLYTEAEETERWIPLDIRLQIARQLGLSDRQIRLDPAQMRLSSSTPLLPFHELLLNSPLESADTVFRATTVFAKSAFPFESALHNASILIDRRIGIIPACEWLSRPPTLAEFAASFTALFEREEDANASNWRDELSGRYSDIPADIQIFLNRFLQQAVQSRFWMAEGGDSIDEIADFETIQNLIAQRDLSPHSIRLLEQLIQKADRKAIFRAAAEMVSTISALIQNRQSRDSYTLQTPIALTTPLGGILIAGIGDDIHNLDRPLLLLIDCGGNDIYRGTYAYNDLNHPFSIVIDLEGQDLYQSDKQPFGSVCGIFGLAALFDLGPKSDTYEGKTRCFGYSFGGVSLLYDESGDSTYNAESLCFGASEAGISLLLDGDGNDRYSSYHDSQGYGALGGLGFLSDERGNDTYIAQATPVINPSPQLADRNTSASQGFGTGRFGPTLDGRSLPGGIGLLCDREGNDTYEAGVFAQGAGYGYGIGVLLDENGGDTYRAAWYAMGAAAHQGAGFLLDTNGDDRYVATHYMMGGAASDFSLAMLVDGDGNDSYRAQNASLGYALTNSFALLLDRRGEDTYEILNRAGAGLAQNELPETLRGLWPSFGIFLDLEGNDRYDNLPDARNNQSWPSPRRADAETYSLGIDCDWSATY